MMKKMLCGTLFLMFLMGCEGLKEENLRQFTYIEEANGYGTAQDYPRIWQLQCEGLQCK